MGLATKSSRRGYIILSTSALLYGTYGVWSRLMGPDFAPFYQGWVRSLLIILMLTPFMWASKSFVPIKRKDWRALSIFIGFCIFTQAPLYYAFNNAPLGTVQFVFYSMFIITAYIVGRFYLGEAITKIKLVSIILAFVGLALVFGNAVIAFAPLGLALALFNGVASGGEVASSKKLEQYPPILIVFWGWVFTLITHLPISLLVHEHQVPFAFNEAWLWLIVYSVVNGLTFWMAIKGFQMVDASIGSIVGLTEVVWGALFGAILFDERLSLSIYLGGAVIIVAAMLPDLMNIINKKKTKHPVEPIRELGID